MPSGPVARRPSLPRVDAASRPTARLAYESVDMISEPGLTLTIYAAEPASSSADALALLASWSATTAEHEDARSRP